MTLVLIVLALAAWRICRLIIEDEITSGIRDFIWSHRRLNSVFGYLITCYWCTSIYVAGILVVGYVLAPTVVFYFALVLALSATVGIIQHIMDSTR